MTKSEAQDEFFNVLSILNHLQFDLKVNCDDKLLIGYKEYIIEIDKIWHPNSTFILP